MGWRSNEGAHPVRFVIVKLRNKDVDEAVQLHQRLAPRRLISVSGSRDKDIILLILTKCRESF